MQLLHPSRHRSLFALNLALTRKQAALKRKLNLATGLIHHSSNNKQAIARSKSLVPRRVATPHSNRRRRLLNYLKVVNNARSLVIVALSKLLRRPQIMRRLRAAILPFQVATLHFKPYPTKERKRRCQLKYRVGHNSPIHRAGCCEREQTYRYLTRRRGSTLA